MCFLFNSFPREIGLPYRLLINNKEMFFSIVNKYNKIKNLYVSLYKYSDGYNNSPIDKLFFDFDGYDSISDVKKLHYYCKENNIKHTMMFSGGGFHLYVATKNCVNLINNKIALFNAQKFFVNKLKLDVDEHIIGDVARITRIPNTFNVRRKFYCIPISEEDLENGIDFLKDKSCKQCFDYKIYGKERFDVKSFDGTRKELVTNFDLGSEVELKISNDDILKDCPKCVAALLVKGDIGWDERSIVIRWFLNKGYLKSETKQVLKKFLTEQRFRNCIIKKRQLNYIYSRYQHYMFDSCESIRAKGLCKSPKIICEQVKELYL